MNKERLKQDFYEAVNEEWQKTVLFVNSFIL